MILPIETTLCNLAREMESRLPLSPEEAAGILSDYTDSLGDLRKLADFDYPLHENYGRTLAYLSDQLEILVMGWRPGSFSAIHDHGAIDFGAIWVLGEAIHRDFVLKNNVLTLRSEVRLPNDSVNWVDASTIHQMGNGGKEELVTLHVYGSNLPNPGFSEFARIFDPATERSYRVKGGAFFDLPEDAIHPPVKAFRGTPEVVQQQAQLLNDYRKQNRA